MQNRKTILCIAPLPPPITGASLVSQDIIGHLRETHDVLLIPYQRGSLASGTFSVSQSLRVLLRTMALMYFRFFRKVDAVYLVVSSSSWGNIRDLAFLAAMGRNFRRKLTIHLHGANFDTMMQNANGLRRWLNRILLSNTRAAIVLGEFFRNIFQGYVAHDRVRILKNYFDPSLLIGEEDIRAKFASSDPVNILYLSNLMKEKGYRALLNAFLALPQKVSQRANLNFAGNIYGQDSEEFMLAIKNRSNVSYHGEVNGTAKRDLLWKSHVFCLPTVIRFEGQPLSILEAYASGCFVLTTRNGGISDIFLDERNGIAVDDDLNVDETKLEGILAQLILHIEECESVAVHNRLEAVGGYSKSLYMQDIERAILGC